MGANGNIRRASATGGAILLLFILSACSARRLPSAIHDLPSASGPYTARFTGSLEWKGRGIPLSGLLAVVPMEGARMEIRDPLGGVLLVAFLGPRSCTLLRPSDGVQATWSGAGTDLPFSAGDLWFLLSGAPPAERLSTRSRGGEFEARWRNGEGKVALKEGTNGAGPAPFSTARMKGPRGAELRMALSAAEARAVPGEALRPPQPPRGAASPSDLLQELRP